MNEPITQLDTRHGEPRTGVTPWEETRRVLETAELFWLATVRADGRPHVTPLVAVWHDGAIHFTATDTAQKTVNLRGNPHVILTTGCNQTEGLTVVVEGDAVRITGQDALERVASVWATKWDGSWPYQGLRLRHRPQPNPLPVLTARVASPRTRGSWRGGVVSPKLPELAG